MEIARLDTNKWACVGNLWGEEYTLERAEMGVGYNTLHCDWFNFLHIPELMYLELRLPCCLDFGQVHYQCTGRLWGVGYSEWGEFWEWFLNDELNIMGYYDFAVTSDGKSDNIFFSEDGYLYFYLANNYRRHEYLKIHSTVLFTRYWNEDTRARVLAPLAMGLSVDKKHRVYRELGKLQKESDPLRLSTAIFNIRTKYWYLFE